MGIKTKVLPILFLIFFFFFFVQYAYSGFKTKYNEIRIAYINGYFEALQLNIDQIKILQSDKELMKEAVLNAANNYLVILEEMNK